MVRFCGLSFEGLQKTTLFEKSEKIKIIIPVNAELIVLAQEVSRFKEIVSKNCATFDGQLPYYFAVKNNHKNIEKISGSDLIYDFCVFAKKFEMKIFLLGGYEESNKNSVKILSDKYQIDIAGYSPPYQPYPFNHETNRLILEKINDYKPDILFVGFGALKQEYWIDDHKEKLENAGIKWVIASGGTFEFVSGKIKRAPKILQKAGVEIVWRLLNEPEWRRFKRILISMKIFKYILMK